MAGIAIKNCHIFDSFLKAYTKNYETQPDQEQPQSLRRAGIVLVI